MNMNMNINKSIYHPANRKANSTHHWRGYMGGDKIIALHQFQTGNIEF